MAEIVLFGGKKIKSLQQQISTLQNQVNLKLGTLFLNNSINQYPEWGVLDEMDKYTTNDDIFSIVNKIAETTALIPSYIYYEKPDSQKSLRSLKAIERAQTFNAKAIFDIQLERVKSLEDAPATDPLAELLEKPNNYQTRSEFEEAIASFYLFNGEAFAHIYSLSEGANAGKPYQLHIWAPQNVEVIPSNTYPAFIKGYNFRVNGVIVMANVPVEDVIHWKSFNPKNPFRGLSPLQVGKKLITRLENNDNITNSQLNNGGVPGMIYDETITNEEVSQTNLDAAREHYYAFTGDVNNKGAAYYTAGKKGFVAIGSTLTEMGVIELHDVDFGRACNMFKISARLFNRKGDSTYNNLITDLKQMYTNACLPLKYSILDGLNKRLTPRYKDNKVRFIDCDVSVIPELQDDMKEMATVISLMPFPPTPNEVRSLLKFDRYEGEDAELADRMWVKAGYSLLSENSMQPIDTALLDANNVNDYNVVKP